MQINLEIYMDNFFTLQNKKIKTPEMKSLS
jgi:hypothetical protein